MITAPPDLAWKQPLDQEEDDKSYINKLDLNHILCFYQLKSKHTASYAAS